MGVDADRSVLIQRAVSGDAHALERLLFVEHDRVLGYVRKNLPGDLAASIDPADIVQDTCFEACRLIAGFQSTGDDCFFRWLIAIARNRMLALHRQYRARRTNGSADRGARVADALEQLASHRRTPSKSAAAHEFMILLERSLGRLRPDYRRVVTLRHLDGLSVPDTAVRMGKSPEAIYLLCSRALRALRVDLESVSFFV